jgi:hypothetical protein
MNSMSTQTIHPDCRHIVGVAVGALALLALPQSAFATIEGSDCQEEPTDQIIAYGDLINCAIDQKGDDDVFRFSGVVGDVVRLQAGGLAGDGVQCFQLFAPDGMSVDFARCGNTSRDYPLSQTGQHTIVMSEAGHNETVEYAMTLERIAPPSPAALPIDYGDVKNEEIAGPGDADTWSFPGEAGDTVRVQSASATDPGVSCFQLFAPDGSQIDFARCGNTSRDYKLVQSGPHTIVMTEAGHDDEVEYALTLECIAGVCPEHDPVPDVAGCISLRGVPIVDTRVRLTQSNTRRQETRTDIRGCYAFDTVVEEKQFKIRIFGPKVPAADLQ